MGSVAFIATTEALIRLLKEGFLGESPYYSGDSPCSCDVGAASSSGSFIEATASWLQRIGSPGSGRVGRGGWNPLEAAAAEIFWKQRRLRYSGSSGDWELGRYATLSISAAVSCLPLLGDVIKTYGILNDKSSAAQGTEDIIANKDEGSIGTARDLEGFTTYKANVDGGGRLGRIAAASDMNHTIMFGGRGESSQADSLYVKGNRDRGHKPEKTGSGKWNFRSKSRDKKTIHCYKCKEAGHMKRDCLKLKKQTDEKRDDSSKSVNVVKDDNSNYSEGDMFSISMTQLTDAWILDSGYLKKNLISLGTLHKNDFIPKADEDSETIQIVKGALTVMKGKMTAGNIYRLLGSTIVGGVYYVESCDDTTKLWHIRLAHLSERVWAYFLKQKSDVFEKFKLWKAEENGIKRHFTVRKTPQQNGVVERMDMSLNERARYHQGHHWMRKFQNRSKLDVKSKECIFLGYKTGVTGFKFWDPVVKKIVIIDLKDYSLGRDRVRQTNIKPPNRLGFEDLISFALTVNNDDPVTFHGVVTSQENDKWMAAMVEEIESLNHNRTWELVRLPEGKKPIGCKWVYKKKPISPRQWYKWFDSYMIKIGYKRCEYDCCVYVKSLDDGSFIFLLLYVDDILITTKNMDDVICLKALLSQEFGMKDLGAAKKILGMKICRDRDSRKLWLSQRGYVEKMLERFTMSSAKPMCTPLANHFKLSSEQCPKTDKEAEYMTKVSYYNAVGCLMYAMVCTRPDLAHVISQVCKYMSKPGYVDSDYTGEYMTAAEAAKEALWLTGLVKELGVQQGGVQLLCDNQSTIHLAKNQVFRLKHHNSQAGMVNEKPRFHVYMPLELLLALDVPVSVLKALYLLPSVIHRLESLMLANQLREEINFHSSNVDIPSSMVCSLILLFNSGCLEKDTLGTVLLIPSLGSSWTTISSSGSLQAWSGISRNCVEALIGACFVSRGIVAGLHVMKWLGVDAELDPSMVSEKALTQESGHEFCCYQYCVPPRTPSLPFLGCHIILNVKDPKRDIVIGRAAISDAGPDVDAWPPVFNDSIGGGGHNGFSVDFSPAAKHLLDSRDGLMFFRHLSENNCFFVESHHQAVSPHPFFSGNKEILDVFSSRDSSWHTRKVHNSSPLVLQSTFTLDERYVYLQGKVFILCHPDLILWFAIGEGNVNVVFNLVPLPDDGFDASKKGRPGLIGSCGGRFQYAQYDHTLRFSTIWVLSVDDRKWTLLYRLSFKALSKHPPLLDLRSMFQPVRFHFNVFTFDPASDNGVIMWTYNLIF
ncbi:hypothetical protein F3Y22_tig00111708pilonHSYRG00525 [Hibiscus syriacus]|uniref:CCHC-type domain-containing protein n=1 Tax=Hibiscus syriacus TaxID=106335 RepID=A0A6A2XHP4_HIBSY|nr:hypothetical protein F3Y22_tig00111708pilonHSYRG00525 [Hibiscus syriacus]